MNARRAGRRRSRTSRRQIGALALQGPLSRAILEQLSPRDDLARSSTSGSSTPRLRDIPVTISRTGYTGDLGYEIWVDAERARRRLGRAHRRRHAVRHHAGGHLGARHRAHRGRPDHARRRLLLGAPRAHRGPEVLALRARPRLDGEPRQRARSTGARRSRRARARARRGASSGSRSTGTRSSALYAERGLAAAAPDRRVAHERADLSRTASRSATRRAAAGRRCSRSTSRSRTCERRTSQPGTAGRDRGHRRAPAQARATPWSRKLPFFDPRAEEAHDARPSATTRSSSAAATTASSRAAYLARAGKKVAGARAPPARRRRGRHRGDLPGLQVLGVLVRREPAAAEIIRDLDLPRHGLQILPLESTVTPLDNGDYLAGWADPDETRARARAAIRRATPRRTTMFGRLMHHMAMAVKPILGMVPPDPASLVAARPAGAAQARRTLPLAGRRALPRAPQAHDDEQRRLPRRVVRVRRAQGDEVGERHHRHVPRPALARARRTCCCTTTWARSTARSARGASRRAAPARSARRSRARRARSAPRSAPTRAVEQVLVQGRPRDRRRARERRGDRAPRRRLGRSIRAARSSSSSSRRSCPTTSSTASAASSSAARPAR